MNLKVFIQTNIRAEVAALVAKYCFQKHNPGIQVELITPEEFPELIAYDGQQFQRGGQKCCWRLDTAQSFFPVRFLVPEKLGYSGIALVFDPDIYALRSINSLSNYFMDHTLGTCMGWNELPTSCMMVLDTSRLTDWSVDNLTRSMFIEHEDFNEWMYLKKYNGTASLAILPDEYNHIDKISENTIFLHTNKTETQPWKTGLQYCRCGIHNRVPCISCQKNLTFQKHASSEVEHYFFQSAHEAIENDVLPMATVETALKNGWVRSDFLNMLKQ